MRRIVDLPTGRKLGLALVVAIVIAGVAAMVPLSRVVGGGRLIYTSSSEESPGAVTFRHYTHVEKSGYQCTDCHYKLFAADQYATKIKMDGIFSGKWCGACHNGEKAFGVDECQKCHVEKKHWLIKNII
jgi:c(7)-type cytochrome triheme protein